VATRSSRRSGIANKIQAAECQPYSLDVALQEVADMFPAVKPPVLFN
jgi:hypothetical protein